MKRIAVLLAFLCSALLATSFALADDGGKEKGPKSDKKCHNISLKGTAAATTFTITVDKSSKAGRDLKGKPLTLTFSGKVNVNAQMCAGDSAAAAGAASTFKLRNLKVAKPQAAEEEDDD